jgi:hypothetical protein
MKYTFSGHETFACKQYWLKKGVDYVTTGKSFTDENAVINLGVGKNMVNSIKFWLKAFGMINDQEKTTFLAEFLFGENGVDVYLEDTLTLWLLHYQLIKLRKATIYSLIFDVFRRERNEFNKSQLQNFIERKISENKETFSEKTLEGDIKTFLNNYLTNNPNDIEEGYSNILQELNLLSCFTRINFEGHKIEWYKFDVSPKFDLPIEVILFTILDNEEYGPSVNLTNLAIDAAGPGSVFMLTEVALSEKLRGLSSKFGVFKETAGNPVLQLREGLEKWELLKAYYESN